MNEQLTPENALSAQHRAWLTHPVTQQLLQNIDNMKNANIKCLTNLTGNTLEDGTFAIKIAFGIRTLESVRVCITNTDKFLEQLTK